MNNYHIYEEIGRGKYSVVYKGRYKKSIEYIAVKSLEKDRRPKVLNEVKILTDLDHDNILKFYKWYETKNHLWIVFEYCAGCDLSKVIETDKSLTESVVKQFGRDLLSGIQYLHSKGIIYCALKPSNVLLNEYGSLKLSDFGQAKRILDLISTQERQNTKRGDPFYMAPELFQDTGVYSFQSDLWAFGCFLYEISSGKPPFSSKSFIDLVNLIVKVQTPVIDNFSPEFNDLLQRLLIKDPIKRIGWKEIVQHPFWGDQKLTYIEVPNQPHFEKWANNHYQSNLFITQNIPPFGQKQDVNSLANVLNQQTLQQNDKNGDQNGFNPLRLSLQVAKDQQKQNNNYNNQEDVSDITLNRNQEIGWGGDNQEEGNNEIDDFDNQQNSGFQQQQQHQQEDSLNNVEKFGNYKKQMEGQHQNKKKFNNELSDAALNHQQPISQNQNLIAGSHTPKSPIDGFQTPVAKSKQVPLEQLFTHNSDNAVKPIIGNKDIEKLPEVNYNVNTLPFKSYTPEEVINGVETADIEQHFEEIYSSLIPTSNDKLNILNYFENIIQHSNVSNRLINSLFMNLLLKLLKTSKSYQVKIRLASIVGLLIRHSTVIENELSQLNIPGIMIEVLQLEKNEKVKRRAIAALGEYLFYAATQIDEDPQNVCWEIKQNCYNGLLTIIKAINEDDLVKFYAAKTIENITAQSVQTGNKFATQEMASALSNLYLTSKNEHLKICAIVSLTHMTVLNNDLIDYIINKFSKNLIGIFTGVDTSPRVQQAFLTIINMQILNSGKLIQTLIDQEQEFTNAVVHLLESQNIVVRGKAILTILLLIKINAITMIYLSENKFFTLLEKLMRDTYKYVQQCLFHMLELLDEMLPHVLKLLLDEFSQMQSSDFQQFLLDQNYTNTALVGGPQQQNKKLILPGNLQFLEVVMQYLNSNTLKSKVYNHKFLETIFAFIEFCDLQNDSTILQQRQQDQSMENQNQDEKVTSDVVENTKAYLFQLYEIIIENNKLLLNNHDFFIKNVIPNMCQKIFNSQQVDLRFNNLKFCINILSQIMNDPHIYDNSKVYGKQLNDFLLQEFVPNLKQILMDLDPVPFYGLKLINLLVEQNQQVFVSAFRRQKLHTIFYEYLQVDHQRMTKNSLKIICQLISHNESPLDELFKANILQNAISIIKTHIIQQQEWALEDLIEIILLMFNKLFELLNAQNLQIQIPDIQNLNINYLNQKQGNFPYQKCINYMKIYETVVDISDILFQQLNTQDYNIQEKASQLIIFILYVFSEQPNHVQKIFNSQSLQYTCKAIFTQNQLQINQNQMQANIIKNNQSHINSTVFQAINNTFMRRICKVLSQGLSVAAFNKYNIMNEKNNEGLSQALKIMNGSEDKVVQGFVKEIIQTINIIQQFH